NFMAEYLPNIVEVNYDDKKAVTPIGRLSYPALLEAKSYRGGVARFSANLKVLKTDVVQGGPQYEKWQQLLRAINTAKIEKFGHDKTKWPKTSGRFKSAIDDGAAPKHIERDPENKDYWIIKASSKKENQPEFIDRDMTKIAPRDTAIIKEKFKGGYYTRFYVQ